MERTSNAIAGAGDRAGLVLVTGGAGFIGSNLAHTLLERGDRVRVLDDLSTGRSVNLADIAADIELVDGDVRDLDQVMRAVDGAAVVFHQAAIPSVARSVADPISSHQVNVTGTVNVLVASRDAGVSWIGGTDAGRQDSSALRNTRSFCDVDKGMGRE